MRMCAIYQKILDVHGMCGYFHVFLCHICITQCTINNGREFDSTVVHTLKCLRCLDLRLKIEHSTVYDSKDTLYKYSDYLLQLACLFFYSPS